MKKILILLSAVYFLATPVFAQDATISFKDVIAQPGTEVLIPLNISDLNNVGSASIFIQYDPVVLTYIGIENNSLVGALANVTGNELRTSWFSLAPVKLSGKVYDVRFMYNGGSTDLDLSFVQMTNEFSELYDIAIVNGSVGDGVKSLELTAPVGGEEWLAGTEHNITWNSSGVENVVIEYSIDAGANWNTVVASTASSGTFSWTLPEISTDQALVRISDADVNVQSRTTGVNDQSDTYFTILSAPVVLDIPDQNIQQCESFAIINLDEFVTYSDDKKNTLAWTSSGEVDLTVSIDDNGVATITVPGSEWSGSETITFTATDPNGLSDSDDAVFTVTAVNSPPEITCPSDVSLELSSSAVMYSGPAAVASDNCDSEPVVTSVPELPVTYTEPGDYVITWTATDADGNSVSCEQSVTVTEFRELFADAGPDKVLLCGESAQIGGNPTAVDGIAPYKYQWSPANGLDNAVSSNPVASPLSTTVYTVSVTDADGTVQTDDVKVTVNDNEAPEIKCPSDATLHLTSSAVTYSGPSAAASDNCDSDPVITSVPVLPVSYTELGEYVITWTATDAHGNSVSCEQTITVTESRDLFADAGPDIVLSCGESVKIGGNPTAGDGNAPYKYQWSPANGLDNANTSNPVAGPLTTTTYTVSVTDADGTVLTDDVTVTVNDNEAPEIKCPSDATLYLSSSAATYSGPSAVASDNCDSDPVVTSVPELPVSYDEPGDYVITWTATDAQGNSTSCDQAINVLESKRGSESSMSIISSTLPELLALNTGEKKIDDILIKSIGKLENSLKPEYWLDDNHLDLKNGKKVFDGGKNAVKELGKILKDKNADQGVKSAVENVITDLLSAYHSLAYLAIEEAEADCFTDRCALFLEKAKKEMLNAEEQIAKGKFDKAVDSYKKAWERNDKSKKHRTKKEWYQDTENVASENLSEYTLNQNYPNPFNPTTLISFTLPESGSVRLAVYNTIGEEVALLAYGVYSAGYHSVQFNADNLNTGLYLYKLETDNFVSVKKMLLVK